MIEKLLSAGLVQDRSKLYKKRRSSKKKGSDDDDDDDGDDVADGYDEGDGFIVREDVNGKIKLILHVCVRMCLFVCVCITCMYMCVCVCVLVMCGFKE